MGTVMGGSTWQKVILNMDGEDTPFKNTTDHVSVNKVENRWMMMMMRLSDKWILFLIGLRSPMPISVEPIFVITKISAATWNKLFQVQPQKTERSAQVQILIETDFVQSLAAQDQLHQFELDLGSSK